MLRSRLQMYTGKEEDNEYNETAKKKRTLEPSSTIAQNVGVQLAYHYTV